MKNLKELLKIKKPSDITSFQIQSIFEDDHLQCAECFINGIFLEFLWYDNIGFVEYWKDSPKAFSDLLKAIKHSIDLEG